MEPVDSNGKYVVIYLVEKCNADVTAKDFYGSVPAGHASGAGYTEVANYINEKCRSRV
jgi:hypothetical protein